MKALRYFKGSLSDLCNYDFRNSKEVKNYGLC